MSYYSKGHNLDDEAFDEYDPTPYGGGYDIHISYGHPLPPSDEICYPPSQNYSDDPVEYTSYADVSAGYDNDDAINNEYSSYTRRPGYGSAANKDQDQDQDQDEEEQQEVVDEYEVPDAERTEFEEVSYEGGEQEEDEYGGRKIMVLTTMEERRMRRRNTIAAHTMTIKEARHSDDHQNRTHVLSINYIGMHGFP